MPVENDTKNEQQLFPVINKLMLIIILLVAVVIALSIMFYNNSTPGKLIENTRSSDAKIVAPQTERMNYWIAPDINTIADAKQKEKIAYGKELVSHTARYLGPNGSVAKISNGMNCQNCHLQAGTAIFGNNFGSVASLYPKFRTRSGAVETVYKRINDCFQRSLDGKEIDTASKEMQAMVAYIAFLGTNTTKGTQALGSGLKDVALMDRAADPEKGKLIYVSKCQSCHQSNGEGIFNTDSSEYMFPPLWGNHSFNDGAGLYRLSNFAKYVKSNMPQGVTYESAQLSDEESWDVAAFIVSQKRPHFPVHRDWPDKSQKPFDHPFGPYSDSFTEKQHKLGPFDPIIATRKKAGDAGRAGAVPSAARH